jgi:GT2 family glycosyltransferase/tRNA A-37 threonylcarbamoyl transferase component Bud32
LKISLIVTTYNWPQALDRVLHALSAQQYTDLEIIVADDGSGDETAKLIQTWQKKCPFPIVHCWQPDEGSRAAMIRNRAVALARYDYLIFIDGDCVTFPDFIANHARLAQKGWFVAGNRVLLTQKWTEQVLEHQVPLHQLSFADWAVARLKRKYNRFFALWKLPLGLLRKIRPHKWQGVKTCNLAVWREDFLRVNGFDESFIGWGSEDSDLVVRLLRSNIQRKTGKCAATVLHLWHPCQERSTSYMPIKSVKGIDQSSPNAQRLHKTIESDHIKAQIGVDQYLEHASAYPTVVSKLGWNNYIRCQEAYYTPAMKAVLADIEGAMHTAWKVLKNDDSSTVVVIKVDGTDVVIKRANAQGIHYFRRLFRCSRARKNWRNAQRLQAIGIHTFEPIALVEDRFGPLTKGAYFLCSYIQGFEARHFFQEAHAQSQRSVATVIAQLVKKLATNWISHRDLNLSNIILVDNQPWLIDLDSMHQHHWQFWAKRAAFRERSRFLRNCEDTPDVSHDIVPLFQAIFKEVSSTQETFAR